MKYYFVSNTSKKYLDVLKEERCRVLCSYHGIKQNEEEFANSELHKYSHGILLDCGAFSAWSLGEVIDLDKYVDFVKRFEDHFERITVLDKIPESQSKKDVLETGEETFKNYQLMKQYVSSTKLVPIFHFGEDFKLLEQYVTDGVDLIGLGGVAGSFKPGSKGKLSIKDSLYWFAKAFRTFPKQKFHGFGMFSKQILLKFPFYSVDSTHWLQSGKYGHILKFNPKKMYIEQLSSKEKDNWIKIESLGGVGDFYDLLDVEGALNYVNRAKVAIIEIKKYIDFVTKLWEVRGIKWT